MSDDEDVNELKAKLQEQAAEFQSYREECRNIEAMLEEDCQKKDDQIRQLKEDSIKREKGQRMLKTQVSQLEAEVANLKAQLGESTKTQPDSANLKQQVDKLTKQNTLLKQKNHLLQEKLQAFNTKVTQYELQLNESMAKSDQLKKLLQQAQNRPQTIISPPPSSSNDSRLQQQSKKLKDKLTALQKQKSKFQKLLKQRESQIDKLRNDFNQKMKKTNDSRANLREQKPAKRQLSQPKQIIPLAEHKLQLAKYKQTVHQLQQKIEKLQYIQNESNQRINGLMSEKQNLQQKNKNLQKQLQRQRQRRHQIASIDSPPKQQHNDDVFAQQTMRNNNNLQQQNASMRMDCLLLTKRHYLSPFIQIKDRKLIKVYKSTKNGYQKSLGATKHKFDSVGYDAETIVHNGSSFAKDSIQRGTSHTILLYGAKRTSKKYLMAALVRSLKDWILQRVSPHSATNNQQQSDYQSSQPNNSIHCMYMKRSAEEQKNYLRQSQGNRQEIQDILEEIISMGLPSSPSKVKNKKSQKPKVRYFAITFEEGLTLEIISTSHLNPFIKNNQTFTDYMNTVVFNKLPNILQSAISNFHIITTINPIVNLYEQCKNTLSITLVPFKQNATTNETSQQMDSRFVFTSQGINKEDLNDLTKKKVQNFQKQTELASLRVRKIEEQCNYFRERLEELEIRLKGLINTSQQQNTYLKKSPVTLSYEKLLKFIKAVLARNSGQTRTSAQLHLGNTSTEEYHNQLEMYIQEDAKSLDGY